MVKVVAKEKGYFGGVIREQGTVFTVPDDKPAPKWTRPFAFGGKGDHDGDGKTGGSKPQEDKPADPNAKASAKRDATAKQDTSPAGPVVVPADWRNGKAAERKALAKAITGEAVTHAADADRVIEAYVESAHKPFDDAPAPEVAKGNSVAELTGSVQPDWIAPGATEKADD